MTRREEGEGVHEVTRRGGGVHEVTRRGGGRRRRGT